MTRKMQQASQTQVLLIQRMISASQAVTHQAKPEPPKALPEEDRTPATTQENQVIDTSLMSSNGLHHGDTIECDCLGCPNGYSFWHVGVENVLD